MLKTNLLFTTILAAGFALSSMQANAAVSTEAIVAEYQAQGYSYIEVTRGVTQTKVEATKGDITVETVYDNETGQILKTESDAADARDIGRSGVEVHDHSHDFVDGTDSDDDSSDDSSSDDDGHEDGHDDHNDGDHDSDHDNDHDGDHDSDHESDHD